MLVTHSGRPFSLEHPDEWPTAFDIHDIARSLSRLCRFGGHTREFYSVAEHSVLMSRFLHDVDHKRAALMHDATEAYLGDMNYNLKRMLPEYQTIETTVLRALEKKYGFEVTEEIHSLDGAFVVSEAYALCGDRQGEYAQRVTGHTPLHIDFQCWLPDAAMEAFLMEYEGLWNS